jgi:hypothetical protein
LIPIFQGLESSDHLKTLLSIRDLFEESPPLAAGISYKSLRSRRLGQAYIEKVAEHCTVVLEAGVSGAQLSADDAARTAEEFYDFVDKTETVSMAIEFDHPTGKYLPESVGPRIVPLVDPVDGPQALQTALDEFGQIAMAYDGDRTLTAVLRRSHGLSISLGEQNLADMAMAGFTASMIQAWLYPAKYGEFIVWDGSRFHRHNPGTSEERERLVGKYSRVVSEVFDLDLIQRRDAREQARLAAWSYVNWGQSLARNLPTEEPEESQNAEVIYLASTHTLPRGVKKIRVQQPLPLFAQDEVTALEESEDGSQDLKSRRVLTTSNETVRVCDTCVLASTCPAYEAGSSCAFNLPIEIRTPAQMRSVISSVLEMQTVRVAFARFAEEVRGGDLDPAVGQEMDRLIRMAEKARKIEERRERLTVSLESEESGGGTGVLSRIFGPRAQPPAISADVIVEQIEPSAH